MPVTELAFLPLAQGTTPASPALHAKLQKSIQVMQTALGIPGRRFTYYQSLETPQLLYLLGDWRSPSEHRDQFLPSPENQELLQLLRDDLDIPRIEMYHVDVPNAAVPADAPVLSLGWFRVRGQDKAAFEGRAKSWAWLSRRDPGQDGVGEASAGGWRIEKASDGHDEDEGQEKEEEWVSFCGWENVDEYEKLAEAVALDKSEHFRDLVCSSQVRRGIRIDFEKNHIEATQ
ncbi:hypothetical protein M406DRAFT_333053 [Cryphonectria parasitica EP155]|uniref:ABM domain-containing protein n=1 Tax=Cryphonectria parasitica (strain ATCC 38755 / EP155) TaxID=660469 RepID=A0A9P4XWN0_CRYP1|nr:uncharacterized protein M406DRAFT_333053 [Cryphonectria parasitica EP155]KAF3762682.1 hypothetical protein M406DRAFT_333053 [Cryphonectria parasitica EP155]